MTVGEGPRRGAGGGEIRGEEFVDRFGAVCQISKHLEVSLF
jgi:hypothetical protein